MLKTNPKALVDPARFAGRVSGFTYQLESRPDLSTTYWSDDGASQAGTGGNLTLNATLSGVGTKFFRIRVQ